MSACTGTDANVSRTLLLCANALHTNQKFGFSNIVSSIHEIPKRHETIQGLRLAVPDWLFTLLTIVAVLMNQ